jgi:hypothetical protein
MVKVTQLQSLTLSSTFAWLAVALAKAGHSDFVIASRIE